MTIKHFFEVYPPKRMWRKLWIGLSSLPMLPQHRSILLKWGGVNIKGHSMVYGGVGIDTVYPDKIFIGKGVRITAGTKILTHYLDPTQPGVHFRKGVKSNFFFSTFKKFSFQLISAVCIQHKVGHFCYSL